MFATVAANPAGLAPSAYFGTVTLTAAGASPVLAPVTLIVWSAASPLEATPSSLTFLRPSDGGYFPAQTLRLSSGTALLPATVTSVTTADGVPWLSASPSPYAQGELSVQAGGSGMLPGTYTGSLTVTPSNGSVSTFVPVTMIVVAGPYTAPVIGSIVGTNSRLQRGVSPAKSSQSMVSAWENWEPHRSVTRTGTSRRKSTTPWFCLTARPHRFCMRRSRRSASSHPPQWPAKR